MHEFRRCKPDRMFVFKHTSTEEGLWESFRTRQYAGFCAESFVVGSEEESPSPNVCVRTNESATSSKRSGATTSSGTSSDPFTLIEEAQQILRKNGSVGASQPKLALVVLEEECVLLMSFLFSFFPFVV